MEDSEYAFHPRYSKAVNRETVRNAEKIRLSIIETLMDVPLSIVATLQDNEKEVFRRMDQDPIVHASISSLQPEATRLDETDRIGKRNKDGQLRSRPTLPSKHVQIDPLEGMMLHKSISCDGGSMRLFLNNGPYHRVNRDYNHRFVYEYKWRQNRLFYRETMVTQVPSQNIFDMYFHAAKFIRQWFVAGVTENPDLRKRLDEHIEAGNWVNSMEQFFDSVLCSCISIRLMIPYFEHNQQLEWYTDSKALPRHQEYNDSGFVAFHTKFVVHLDFVKSVEDALTSDTVRIRRRSLCPRNEVGDDISFCQHDYYGKRFKPSLSNQTKSLMAIENIKEHISTFGTPVYRAHSRP